MITFETFHFVISTAGPDDSDTVRMIPYREVEGVTVSLAVNGNGMRGRTITVRTQGEWLVAERTFGPSDEQDQIRERAMTRAHWLLWAGGSRESGFLDDKVIDDLNGVEQD